VPLERHCPSCQGYVKAGDRFCPTCGTSLESGLALSGKPLPVSGGIKTGDVGVIHGNIDTSTYVGALTSISARHVEVHLGTKKVQVPSQQCLDQAEALVESGAYREARNLLNDLVEREPGLPHARVFLALALLAGRNPELVNDGIAGQVESHLRMAIQAQPADGLAWALLGIFKQERYEAHGMSAGSPSLELIISSLSALSLSARDQAWIQSTRPARKSLVRLGIAEERP
jgi:hypothetical protein